jgi:PII-like signaling protein/predicted transcriptional regulator
MIKTGIMQRLMIFIDETDRYQGVNLSGAIVGKLRSEGISGATVWRGTSGFGSHGTVHTTSILDLAISLPEIIMAIDSEEKIQAVLPKLEEMIGEGLIVVDQVDAIKISKGDKTDGNKTGANKAITSKDADKKQQQTAAMQLQAEAELHKVSEYMDKAPITAKPQQTVAEIISLMINNGRALLPVINDQGNLLGVVQSEDLLAHMLNVHPGGFHFFGLRGNEQKQFSQDIKSQTASQVMRTTPPVVQEETSMFKATQLMLNQKLKALPVVQGEKLVGVLRLPDVLKIALEIDCKVHGDLS